MRGVLLGVVTAICALLSACGPSEPTAEIFPTVPAAGVVTYQGKPLANHEVLFYPTADGQRMARGVTDKEGRFTLGTNAEDDGAVAGTHQVAIVAALPASTVEPGQEQPNEKIPQLQTTIPEKFSNHTTSGLTQTIPESGATDIKIDLQ